MPGFPVAAMISDASVKQALAASNRPAAVSANTLWKLSAAGSAVSAPWSRASCTQRMLPPWCRREALPDGGGAGGLLPQLAQVGVGRFGGLDADPGADGQDAIRAGDDRAQVQFGDLREIVGQLGNPQQHALE